MLHAFFSQDIFVVIFLVVDHFFQEIFVGTFGVTIFFSVSSNVTPVFSWNNAIHFLFLLFFDNWMNVKGCDQRHSPSSTFGWKMSWTTICKNVNKQLTIFFCLLDLHAKICRVSNNLIYNSTLLFYLCSINQFKNNKTNKIYSKLSI